MESRLSAPDVLQGMPFPRIGAEQPASKTQKYQKCRVIKPENMWPKPSGVTNPRNDCFPAPQEFPGLVTDSNFRNLCPGWFPGGFRVVPEPGGLGVRNSFH